MKLIEKKNQNRRDFIGIYECENCRKMDKISGYDDRNFHDNVIPLTKCKHCDKSTNDLGVPIQNVTTKYPENMIV